MNIATAMAIEAFRKREQAIRRLSKAEIEVRNAVRMVSSKEFDIYVLGTEVIRLEFEAKDSKEDKNPEGYELSILAAADVRRKLNRKLKEIGQ